MATPAWSSVDPPTRDAEQRPRSRKHGFEGRELDHRLANSLQLATDFLLFEYARVSDPTARTALSEAAARLGAVAQLHRFLSAHDHTASVDLEAFLTRLAGFIAGSTGLRCTVAADPLAVRGEVAQQLAIVINELAMNTAKHGYRVGEPGVLHIEASIVGGRLRLAVSDEGGGLGKDFVAGAGKGLGMTIVSAIVRQLNASLETSNSGGAVFTITMPLPAAERPISRSFAPPEWGP